MNNVRKNRLVKSLSLHWNLFKNYVTIVVFNLIQWKSKIKREYGKYVLLLMYLYESNCDVKCEDVVQIN